MAGSRKRKQIINWEAVDISETDIMSNWRRHRVNLNKCGSSTSYYCAFGRYNCNAKVQVKRYNDGTTIVFSNGEEHSNHRKAPLGLTSEQKKVVSDLCLANVDRPTDIYEILKVKKVPLPEKLKLSNFIKYYRRKKLCFKNNVGEVVSWCNDNVSVPSDCDKPFVVKYDIRECQNKEPILRIFISTKRLLCIAPHFTHVHADATYKLNSQGYPVLVVGTTDRKRKFHPFGIALCKNEETEDFQFLLEALKYGVETVSKVDYKPSILVADCAEAIGNAFKLVFGNDIKRVYCFFHVKKAYDKRLLTISNENLRQQISNDIMHLHYASSTDIFKAAAILWCDKWSDTGNMQVIKFVNYFMKNWVHKAPNWFVGYTAGLYVPVTNNALESCNKYIKTLYTKRRTRSLGELTETSTKMIANWSIRRDCNSADKNLVEYKPDFNMQILRLAYSWRKSNPQVAYQRVQGNGFVGCFTAVDGDKVKPSDKSRLLSPSRHLHWTTFSAFVKSEINYLRVSGLYSDHFSDFKCTCIQHFKSYVCKHVVTFASLNNTFKFPPEAITGGLGQKPRRGRPRKMSYALSKQ